jgi:hypothetical protein
MSVVASSAWRHRQRASVPLESIREPPRTSHGGGAIPLSSNRPRFVPAIGGEAVPVSGPNWTAFEPRNGRCHLASTPGVVARPSCLSPPDAGCPFTEIVGSGQLDADRLLSGGKIAITMRIEAFTELEGIPAVVAQIIGLMFTECLAQSNDIDAYQRPDRPPSTAQLRHNVIFMRKANANSGQRQLQGFVCPFKPANMLAEVRRPIAASLSRQLKRRKCILHHGFRPA